jgi:hypothetical protein
MILDDTRWVDQHHGQWGHLKSHPSSIRSEGPGSSRDLSHVDAALESRF